jgi:hypothetical protein
MEKVMIKPDLYTKSVRTVIALTMAWMAYNSNTKSVQAAGATPVVITGIQLPNAGGVLPVGIIAIGWQNLQGGGGTWRQGPLPVAVTNPRVPVTIAASSLSQPIPVKIADTKSQNSDANPK